MKLYWEAHGSGDPVVLIMGLSLTSRMWFRLLPALTGQHRVIVFDNRGSGRSDAPLPPYSIAGFARDTRAVMEAAGVERAHIIGASMGGMIAQELARQVPHQVRTLMLACTTCGGLRFKFPDRRRIEGWQRAGLSREAKIRFTEGFLYGDQTPRDRRDEDAEVRIPEMPPVRNVVKQMTSFLTWSSYRWLPKLRMPAMIVHGSDDRVVPLENGLILKQRLTQAEMHVLEGAGHLFITDEPDRTRELASDFLARHGDA